MPRTTIFDWVFRSPAARQRLIYWQTVPLRRLVPLLLAMFCLFGMVGFILDLFALGQKPIVSVFIWTAFTGAMAVSYVLVLTRAPRYVLVVIAVHLSGSRLIALLMHTVLLSSTHPSTESGVRTAAIAVLLLSMAACVFFLLFIQGEGRHSVRIQTELSLAHGIQRTLVPIIDKQFGNCEIYGTSLPSDRVGGDLVDAVQLSDGSVFAYVADVAGHGLSAGILMGMIKSAVRTQLLDLPSTTAVFDRLNRVLPDVKEAHMYATCTALRILPAPNCVQVEYAVAGQPALIYVAAGEHKTSQLSDEQIPLGLLANSTYRSHQFQVRARDLLLVATDGILEAEGKTAEPFGHARLEEILLANLTAPLATIAAQIQLALRSGYRQEDDQSLLLIRF